MLACQILNIFSYFIIKYVGYIVGSCNAWCFSWICCLERCVLLGLVLDNFLVQIGILLVIYTFENIKQDICSHSGGQETLAEGKMFKKLPVRMAWTQRMCSAACWCLHRHAVGLKFWDHFGNLEIKMWIKSLNKRVLALKKRYKVSLKFKIIMILFCVF